MLPHAITSLLAKVKFYLWNNKRILFGFQPNGKIIIYIYIRIYIKNFGANLNL